MMRYLVSEYTTYHVVSVLIAYFPTILNCCSYLDLPASDPNYNLLLAVFKMEHSVYNTF